MVSMIERVLVEKEEGKCSMTRALHVLHFVQSARHSHSTITPILHCVFVESDVPIYSHSVLYVTNSE